MHSLITIYWTVQTKDGSGNRKTENDHTNYSGKTLLKNVILKVRQTLLCF